MYLGSLKTEIQNSWIGSGYIHSQQESYCLSFFGTIYFCISTSIITFAILAGICIKCLIHCSFLLKKPIQLPLVLTFIKLFYWVCGRMVFLPAVASNQSMDSSFLLLFGERLMLVAMATISFLITRDHLVDLEWGVHTPANLLNEHQQRIFFLLNLLGLYGLLVLFFAIETHHFNHLFQLANAAALWFLLVLFPESSRRPVLLRLGGRNFVVGTPVLTVTGDNF